MGQVTVVFQSLPAHLDLAKFKAHLSPPLGMPCLPGGQPPLSQVEATLENPVSGKSHQKTAWVSVG